MAANACDLTTAATVAGDLGVSADATVQRVVTAASRIIARYCGRTFEKGTVTEYPDAAERPYLQLARPPVNSITSITELGSALTAGTDFECVGDNVEAGLVYRLGGRWAFTGSVGGYISGIPEATQGRSDASGITAVYSGGWATPGQNSLNSGTFPTVDLPEDVQEAAIMTAVALYRLRGNDPRVSSEALGDWSVSYTDKPPEDDLPIPALARAILAPYRRFRVL